jgi:hypothetical protein
MLNDMATLISTLGFPVAVVCYLLWERYWLAKEVRRERMATQIHLEKVIKNDLVHAIDDLKSEIIKLNERCNGGKKKD